MAINRDKCKHLAEEFLKNHSRKLLQVAAFEQGFWRDKVKANRLAGVIVRLSNIMEGVAEHGNPPENAAGTFSEALKIIGKQVSDNLPELPTDTGIDAEKVAHSRDQLLQIQSSLIEMRQALGLGRDRG